MATTDLDTLRQLLARATGFYHSGTATGGSTSTVVDASTTPFDAYDDNILKGKWLTIIQDGGGAQAAPTGQSRKISGVSTTTATVDTNYSAAAANTDTYEITPFNARFYNEAI